MLSATDLLRTRDVKQDFSVEIVSRHRWMRRPGFGHILTHKGLLNWPVYKASLLKLLHYSFSDAIVTTQEFGNIFRKIGSDLSDVAEGKCACPGDGEDMVSKA